MHSEWHLDWFVCTSVQTTPGLLWITQSLETLVLSNSCNYRVILCQVAWRPYGHLFWLGSSSNVLIYFIIRPMAIAMAFLSLYLLYCVSFKTQYISSSFELWLYLLEPIGHICFSRCKWYILFFIIYSLLFKSHFMRVLDQMIQYDPTF